jgi:hypothetical protein
MRIPAARGEVLPAEKDRRLCVAIANVAITSIKPFLHEANADPSDDDEDQQQPTRDGGTPPRNQMRSTHANDGTQRRQQTEQYAAPPRGSKPFQPAKIIDRCPPGLRCRHLEGRDLFQVLIKKWSSAMADDAHRVGEATRWIGILQQLLVAVAPTDEVRDEVRKPRDGNGSKITPVVPTPRRYGGNPVLQAILSGVSQETDVTNVHTGESGPRHVK